LLSDAHLSEELVFLWRDDLNPVVINDKLTTEPFELQAYGYDYCTSNTTSGEYSCLEVQLSFGRSALEQYMVLAYLPIAALVAVAYLTLWVPERRGPRLICALAAFAVTALTAAVITTLDPNSNDSTALDCFTKWSVLFAFIPIIAILITGCGQVTIKCYIKTVKTKTKFFYLMVIQKLQIFHFIYVHGIDLHNKKCTNY
jgi:hypothetical protein